MNDYKNKHNVQSIAVIGAGAAGLICAKELIQAGFEVSIFEKSDCVGGLWVYQEDTELDLLGLNREQRIHSSLYDSLRTNLPRNIMSLWDYTFDSQGGGDDRWPRFPHHTQVKTYLDNFANDYHLNEHIEFNTEVKNLDASNPAQAITLSLFNNDTKQSRSLAFDAVAICNGHFAEPRVPPLNNSQAFTGTLMHCHNYRRPESFKNKRVAVFGVSASGADISREIASQATDVYWCGDTFNKLQGENISDPENKNIHFYSCPTGFSEQGQLEFKHNNAVTIDSFVYATGYHYDFPFITDGQLATVDDNYVSPLYKQIVSANNPRVGFIGIPFMVIPFPFFAVQSKWFTKSLKGEFKLPDRDNMLNAIDETVKNLQSKGRKQRLYHQLGDEHNAYLENLLEEMGEPSLPDWFVSIMQECEHVRTKHPTSFRDEDYLCEGPTKVISS